MKNYIVNQVKELVQQYNTRDPYEIAEEKDILVVHQPMVEERKGIFFQCGEGSAIIINSKLNHQAKIFATAHELLHATNHNDETAFVRKNNVHEKDKVLEIECNLFAVELLIDEVFLRDNEGKTIKELSDLTGMPETMILNKYEEVLKKNRSSGIII